jgi:site-specific recombinase XerD
MLLVFNCLSLHKKLRQITMNRQSDYINFDSALRKGNELLKNEKTSVLGFYIIFSVNAGLRVSDVLKLKHSDLSNKKENDILIVNEKKTNKIRNITINSHIEKAYNHLVEGLKKRNLFDEADFIFVSQKSSVYTNSSLNKLLKSVFNSTRLNISTHSLRKSFGRRVYENNMQSDHSLVLLSEIFCHSSISTTRKYLGLRREEIGNVYLSL